MPIGHRNGACAHSSGPRTGTRGSYLGGIDTRRSFYPIRQCAEAEEVDGEVVDAEAEQRLAAQRAFFDQVRSDEGLLAAAAEELRVEDERRERVSFPRNAAERTTFRQIRAGIASAGRSLAVLVRHDISDWDRADVLEAAGRALKGAGERALELSAELHRRLREPNR